MQLAAVCARYLSKPGLWLQVCMQDREGGKTTKEVQVSAKGKYHQVKRLHASLFVPIQTVLCQRQLLGSIDLLDLDKPVHVHVMLYVTPACCNQYAAGHLSQICKECIAAIWQKK